MTYDSQLPEFLELEKTTSVHLTAQGEMCNRLARGTRVVPVRRKGDWIKILWRKGKKKGWIFFPNTSIKST